MSNIDAICPQYFPLAVCWICGVKPTDTEDQSNMFYLRDDEVIEQRELETGRVSQSRRRSSVSILNNKMI
jgi:hypothetical protein